jgi:hypothetical protein
VPSREKLRQLHYPIPAVADHRLRWHYSFMIPPRLPRPRLIELPKKYRTYFNRKREWPQIWSIDLPHLACNYKLVLKHTLQPLSSPS